MKWFLIATVLNIQTGEPQSGGLIDTFDDPVKCVQAAIDQGPQAATEGTIVVFRCILSDAKQPEKTT